MTSPVEQRQIENLLGEKLMHGELADFYFSMSRDKYSFGAALKVVVNKILESLDSITVTLSPRQFVRISGATMTYVQTPLRTPPLNWIKENLSM
mmetsp:Transcript_24920/g.34889  ORF Transcript_24920/g.34889 Transcript_24920/m.34889 type:complete len:94 (+) Transcript_24920:138-419(+)